MSQSDKNRSLSLNRAGWKLPRLQLPPKSVHRLLDAIPGLLDWASLIFIIVGAVTAPLIVFTAAAFVGVYLAIRIALAAYASVQGIRRIRQWERIDWHAEYESRRQAAAKLEPLPDMLLWEDVLHLIVIPNYNEDLIVLRQTLDHLALQTLAQTQVVIVLAMEAREPNATDKAILLQNEYRSRFKHVLYTVHPEKLVGEKRVKSANETWAVRMAKRRLVDEMGYPLDHIIVTTSDADSLLHPHYLDGLTCLFATTPKRHTTIWQAPIRYHNNVWDIHPAFSIIHAYSAVWELAYQSAKWWRTIPISTYALSLQLIDSVGYWDTDVIPDESHMFLKCFFQYSGQVTINEIFLPFSCYAVTGDTFWDACKNRYAQTLRHAWGATEISYAVGQALNHPEIPASDRASLVTRIAHDNITAGPGWIIVTLGAQLPILLNPSILATAWHFPPFLILEASLAVVALISILFWFLDLQMRPPRAHPWTRRELAVTALSFVMLPILTVIFLGLPVIEAQTRMMLGISLDFKVARKV